MMYAQTRPSVNYAKDWLDQLFLIPGLVWCGKGYHLWMWSPWDSQKPFSCVLGHFRHGDVKTTNWVILVQVCSWPVWEGSLLQKRNGGTDGLPSCQNFTRWWTITKCYAFGLNDVHYLQWMDFSISQKGQNGYWERISIQHVAEKWRRYFSPVQRSELIFVRGATT